MAEILQFPPRSLLALIADVNAILRGEGDPGKTLATCEQVMREIGAVKGDDGEWRLPKNGSDAQP